MVERWFGILVGALAALASSNQMAAAQDDFPDRPIHVITPYAPGGASESSTTDGISSSTIGARDQPCVLASK